MTTAVWDSVLNNYTLWLCSIEIGVSHSLIVQYEIGNFSQLWLCKYVDRCFSRCVIVQYVDRCFSLLCNWLQVWDYKPVSNNICDCAVWDRCFSQLWLCSMRSMFLTLWLCSMRSDSHSHSSDCAVWRLQVFLTLWSLQYCRSYDSITILMSCAVWDHGVSHSLIVPVWDHGCFATSLTGAVWDRSFLTLCIVQYLRYQVFHHAVISAVWQSVFLTL